MRYLSLLPLFIFSVYAHPASSCDISFLKKNDRYCLSDGEFAFSARPELVSRELRSLDPSKLAALLSTGKAYVKVSQCDDGELTMDLVPRCEGGGWLGAVGGYITGEVVGRVTVAIGGTLVLVGTQGVIRLVAGKEAEEAFAEKMADRFLPGVEIVSERVGHWLGAALGIVGAATPVP